MSELLLEALRAFLKRRLRRLERIRVDFPTRRRLCTGNSWTGGTLGCIVADCAFSSVRSPIETSWNLQKSPEISRNLMKSE